jgi:hypothetical protein
VIPELGRLARAGISLATVGYLNSLWRRRRRQALPHNLPGRLALTLTSYFPRFPTLALTLKSLLAQSTRPDRLDLWIARAEVASLPKSVTRLQAEGLEIRPCDDLRSYKKIIPALASGRGDFLVIADDDVYYPHHWLRDIVDGYRADPNEVICGRAHRMTLHETGLPMPYSLWEGEVAAGDASRFLFPTGIGGVLYSPGIFHPDVTRVAAMNGARFRKVGPRRQYVAWLHSQHVALFLTNTIADDRSSNDEQIANMIAAYGFPHENASSNCRQPNNCNVTDF